MPYGIPQLQHDDIFISVGDFSIMAISCYNLAL